LNSLAYKASDKHRAAAATLIPSIIAALKRAGNCGAIQAQGDRPRPTSIQHPSLTEMLASSLAGLGCLGNLCTVLDGILSEAMVARMDQVIAADGLTVTMEAMLNHPVLKKDEISFTTGHEPDSVIRDGLHLLWKMTDDDAAGHEERRVTLRKAGVLQVLVPVVAAFTKAEIKAGTKPDVSNNKVKASCRVLDRLVGEARLEACMQGEDPLSDMLTEEDMMVLVGTEEEPGFFYILNEEIYKAQLPGQVATR